MTDAPSPLRVLHLNLITSLRLAHALKERKRWCAAGQENAQEFSTRAMIEGYLQCYATIAGGVAKAPNSFVSESGRNA